MIDSNELVSVSVVITERKIRLCELLQKLLEKQGIVKSEEEIVNTVNKLKNSDLLTTYEQETQTVSGKNFDIEKILFQQPEVKSFLKEKLFN